MAETHLTDGWEPATPHADSLCRRFVHHWAEQNVAFAAAAGGTVVHTDRFILADYGYPTGFFNGVVLLAPPPDWDEVLDELDPLLAGGTGDVLLWSLWPTTDLRRRDWLLMGHPPLLLRPPAELAPVPPPAPTPRVVGTAADLAVWEDVAVRAYPLPELVGGQAGRLINPALLADERLTFRISDNTSDSSDDAGVLRTPVSRSPRTSSRTALGASPSVRRCPAPAGAGTGRSTRGRGCGPGPTSGTAGSSPTTAAR
ncbi:MAG: hypothetical protein JWR58_1483 [Pseudonocardia sp.]|nr:hypothetical protein [Pseudonocardia sp.]